MELLKRLFTTAFFFLLLDSFWLGFLAKNMYRERLGPVINLEFNFGVAAFFYLFYIAGIVYFALSPAIREGSWKRALINGSALGFLCYATYDLTNMATIADWPLYIVIVDVIWGMVVTGGSALGAFSVLRRSTITK